jgi:hypothetical protein
MECYHCATIHPELTEVLPEFADGYAAQYYVGHGAEFGEEIKGFTVDGSEGFDKLPGVTDDQDRRYYAITIKPQVFVNLVPDHVIFHRMYPVAEDRTIVECDWLYSRGRRVGQGRLPLGGAVPPGERPGLRRLRAVPAGDVLPRVRQRRRPGAQSEHHIGELPRLGHGSGRAGADAGGSGLAGSDEVGSDEVGAAGRAEPEVEISSSARRWNTASALAVLPYKRVSFRACRCASPHSRCLACSLRNSSASAE